MNWKRIGLITAGLLVPAAAALAATSGLPVDGPITTAVNFVSTDVAYAGIAGGFGMMAADSLTGHRFDGVLGHGLKTTMAGGFCSLIAPVAAGLGLSAGALLKAVA